MQSIIKYLKMFILLGNSVCLVGLAGCREGGLSVTTVGSDQLLEEDTSETEEESGTEAETLIAGRIITEEPEAESENLFVYVCGAVVNEGVYELPTSSRVYVAIEAAGGMTEDAAESYLNLAELVSDGERIYVPTQQEVDEGTISLLIPDDDSEDSAGGLVNINTASADQLMTLSGIGEKKAEDIISYRNSNGNFGSIEDIKNVSGIGDSTFEAIKDSITVQ